MTGVGTHGRSPENQGVGDESALDLVREGAADNESAYILEMRREFAELRALEDRLAALRELAR